MEQETITYEKEKILRIVNFLNVLEFKSIENARKIAQIADILDTGIPGKIVTKGDDSVDSNRID